MDEQEKLNILREKIDSADAHEIYAPEEIADKSIALSGDIAITLKALK